MRWPRIFALSLSVSSAPLVLGGLLLAGRANAAYVGGAAAASASVASTAPGATPAVPPVRSASSAADGAARPVSIAGSATQPVTWSAPRQLGPSGDQRAFLPGPAAAHRAPLGPSGADLALSGWVLGGGQAQPGGVVVYALDYANWGSDVATDTVIVDTLPPSTTLAGDTSGLPFVEADGVVTWTVGDLAPGAERAFAVTLNVDPGASGDVAANCAVLAASLPDMNPGNEAACTGPVPLATGEVGANVDQWAQPGDPRPGERFRYDLRVCSSRSTAYGPVWLTDTLPLSTTLISWEPGNWREPVWNEASRVNGQLVLSAPGMPGNFCSHVLLTLRLDPGVALGTHLRNTLDLSTPDDIDPGNNHLVTTSAWAGAPRFDLAIDQALDNGVLVPGGWASFNVNYRNQGNSATSGWLTVTLPAGTLYQPNSAWDANKQPFEPVTATTTEIVWDLGPLAVNSTGRLNYALDLASGLTPTTVLDVCAAAFPAQPEATPPDNTACSTTVVAAHGPNLYVSKRHDWYGSNRLHYEVTFANQGDVPVTTTVTLTDTYPLNVTLAGTPGWDYWESVAWHDTGTDLVFEFAELQPGWRARVWFEVDLTDPNARPRWYTNTAAIDIPPGEADTGDNTALDVAVKPEVDRVELDVDTSHSHAWGQAQPGATVTVTTAYATVTTTADPGCDGCWNMNDIGQVRPGESVTVAAGAATQPVTFVVPAPFTAEADASAGTVSGQVDALNTRPLDVNVSGGPGLTAWTDAAGHFAVAFGQLARDAEGDVRYVTQVDDTQVMLHGHFRTAELLLRVNYGQDWVEGRYPPGHTVWITATDSGGAIKATAVLSSLALPWWNGDTGFSTNNEGWTGPQPDLQPGDWVYAQTENGHATSVRLGTVDGSISAATDSVSGTITVPWLSGLLDAHCSVWEQDGPNIDFQVEAAGGAYACDFSSSWDLLPGQNVGVSYFDPSRNEVINVFSEPTSHLQVKKWAEGQPAVGGALVFHLDVYNWGGAAADEVVVTDTLSGFRYLDDLSGFPVLTSTVPGGEQVVWQLGTVAPGADVQLELYAQVTAGEVGDPVANAVDVTTTSPFDQGGPGEKHAEWSGVVAGNDTQLNLSLNVWTWDPLPGSDYVYNLNVCNNGSTSSGPLTLTDTLPLSTTLVSWWGQHTGWTQVLSDTGTLVVARGSAPSYWCGEVYVRVHLDAAAVGGQGLEDTATLFAASDQTTGDDTRTLDHNVAGSARPNLHLDKNWSSGRLVPGGHIYFNLNLRNDGNLALAGVRVTDTLPAGTHFVGAWRYGPLGQVPVTPTLATAGAAVWDLGRLDNGYGDNFDVELVIDALPDTTLVNCATISAGALEVDPYDNTGCVSDQVRPIGPNLRVVKVADWRDPSQLHYGLRLENVGTTTVFGVALTDSLPAGATLDKWYLNVPGGWGPWSALESGGVITATLDRLEPGWTTWLDVYLSVPGVAAGTRYTNTAEITLPPGDVNPADNTAVSVATTGPNLTLTKTRTGGPAWVPAGQVLTYTLHYANATAWGLTGPIWLTDTLPAGLVFVGAQQRYCGDFFCDRWPDAIVPLGDGRTALAWDLGGKGGANDLIVTVRVAAGLPASTPLVNTAEIASLDPGDVEFDGGDNTASATVWALNPAFMVGKTYDGNRVAGTVITYTLTVTNTGNLTGTTVVLSDALPASLTYGGGNGTHAGDLITWTLPSLSPGGGASPAWFTGTLACTAGTLVTNDQYAVVASAQGFTSPTGLPVSFTVLSPTISLTLQRAPATGVVSGSVAFTGTAATDGTPLAYDWHFGDGAIAAGGLTRSHVYAQAGVYTATLTATDGCGIGAAQTAAVTVSAPTINASFGHAPSPADIVVGGTVSFTDTSTTNGPPLVAWHWQFGDGGVSATPYPTHTYTSPGTFTVTLTVTDALGFGDVEERPALVHVSTGCQACTGLTWEVSPVEPHVGFPVSFTSHVTPANASLPVTYAWSFGDGITVTTAAPTLAHTYLGWGTFTVQVTATNACTPVGATYSREIQVAPYRVLLPLVRRP